MTKKKDGKGKGKDVKKATKKDVTTAAAEEKAPKKTDVKAGKEKASKKTDVKAGKEKAPKGPKIDEIVEYEGHKLTVYEDKHVVSDEGKNFTGLEDAMDYYDGLAEEKAAVEKPDPGKPDKPFFEKHSDALKKASESTVRGSTVGLVDIYNVLLDIRNILTGKVALTKAATPGTKNGGAKTGRVKLTTAQKKERKEELKAGMPYSDKDLDNMKGVEIRMLGASMGLKTFGVHPNATRTELKKMSAKMASKTTKKK
jgi:hypothetical protein